ncbi:MAG: UvrD-helicase domain-containing protein, partial [Candidatus Poribacteria bacterium]|nr:UvrD-helicase domain-containing protein [Candidatus Poribacteria bacterium]
LDIYESGTIENIRSVLQSYQDKLDEYDALDFDDLLVKTVELLERVEEVREAYRREISYILVDEYHDVNNVQYRLLQLLCPPPEGNLMVVADEDQAIYSWRGSNPQYIEDFKIDFNPETLTLDDHYRCSEKILRAAEEVISKNIERQKQHTLRTHKDVGRDIFHYTFDTPVAEALGVIDVIRKLVEQRNYSYRDIAIFYRTHRLADVLAEQLLRANIQFQRVQPMNSFGEGNSKNILAYLRFIQWQLPQDLERAINFPETCIDDLTWVRLKWLAQREHIAFIELLKNIEAYPQDVGPLTRRNVRQFWTQLEDLSTEIEGEAVDKIILKLFDTLEVARSPYRAEELEVIERQTELSNLVTAQDVLYSALDLDEPIQITVSHGIDEYCAAHTIHQTLQTYLDHTAQLQFLPPDENDVTQMANGVHILIGDFSEIGESGRNARTILIGTADVIDTDAIHLGTERIRSLAALKLCQRLINRFESPNMAGMVVYDLETTGINPKTAEIVEIAAQRLGIAGDEVDRFYRLVKPPGGHIPRAATRVHRIDAETVKDAPGIEIVLPELIGFIQDRILIGHNVAEYDNPILSRDLRRYLKRDLSAPHYDTLATARRLFPRQRCSMAALAEKFGIEHGRLHGALEDVEVNREIFKELIKIDAYKREVKSLTELLPLVGVGILAKTSASATKETLTESDAFLNAAKRVVQTHDPKLPDRFPLETEEAEQATTYMEELQDVPPPEFPEDLAWRQRRIQFMNAVLHFESMSDMNKLTDFLDYQKLLTNVDELDDTTEQLTLMTLHAAKGTEFPIVIIIGMEEGSFPMWRQDITEAELEEERRLFYVGMTRAQAQLYLSSVTYRFGDRDRASSMFVKEIPSNYVIRWSPQRRR